MGSLCPKSQPPPSQNIAQAQRPTTNAKPAVIMAAPDSQRVQIALERRKERDNQFKRGLDRHQSTFSSGPKNQKPTLNSHLSHMHTDVFSDGKNSICGRNFSRSTTIITKSSRLERMVSYISEPEGINSFLSSSSNDRKQQVLILSDGGLSREGHAKLLPGFYSLINSKAYVKKPNRQMLKVSSPQGRSELQCQPEQVRETIFLSEGIPIDNIRLLSGNSSSHSPTSFLVEPNFELEIKLSLRCSKCSRPVKYEFAVALIELNFACECGCKDFQFVEVSSSKSVPLWIDGRRLVAGTMYYRRGGFIRAMGCTDCWRFSDCEVLDCGCWKCSDCIANCGADCVLCSI